MKTYKDIVFKKHPNFDGVQGILDFDNGYGISIVRFKSMYREGYSSYTDNENEWELAIRKGDSLCYDTGITEDVMGHLTVDQAEDVMKKVQELPKV